jgi:hypothetical protein
MAINGRRSCLVIDWPSAIIRVPGHRLAFGDHCVPGGRLAIGDHA